MLIGFTSNNISKVLDGTKTQTRRWNKYQLGIYEIKEPKRLLMFDDQGHALIKYEADSAKYWVPVFVANQQIIKGKSGQLLSMGGKKLLYRNIKIEITDVWLERLKDISPEDAIAEGIDRNSPDPVKEFQELWDSIYKGGYSWENSKDCVIYCHRFELLTQPSIPQILVQQSSPAKQQAFYKQLELAI